MLSLALLRCHSASVYRTKSRNLIAWQGRRVVHPAMKLEDYKGRWACSSWATHKGPAIVPRAPINGGSSTGFYQHCRMPRDSILLRPAVVMIFDQMAAISWSRFHIFPNALPLPPYARAPPQKHHLDWALVSGGGYRSSAAEL